MPSKLELNLTGIAWPVCLLKFKSALSSLGAHDVLEVLAGDPDVVDNILMIVNHSADRVVDQRKEGETYRIAIEKNEGRGMA
jgi:TusA-related sulfurtransferase